jgi:uncharacterized protein YndB with AHSA1/START domain
MTTTSHATVTLPAEAEILVVRAFDAPPDLVYRAYTTPELVRRWWAGERGEMTVCEIDARVGGAWRYVMVATEGGFEVAFHGEYRALEPGRRIEHSEVFEGLPDLGVPGGASETVVDLAALGASRTRMEMRMIFASRAERDMVLETGMEAGMQESLALLDDVAGSLAA